MDFPNISVSTMISIHTPAKGATPEGGIVVGIAMISIHTPAKGATADLVTIDADRPNFNPHTREGCDLLIRQIPRSH